MSATTDLRKLIKLKMQTTQGESYHLAAPKDAIYPYKTFELSSVAFPDRLRDDLELTVDIWDRATDWKRVEEIADAIERLFNDANLPEPPLYPTFFRDNRYTLQDSDKTLQHIQLRFLVQLYKED